MKEKKYTYSVNFSDDEIEGVGPNGELHLRQGVKRVFYFDETEDNAPAIINEIKAAVRREDENYD